MTSIRIPVETYDQAGEARRSAASLASSLGLDENTAGRLAIVVMECANNLWKHAGGGEILLTPLGPDTPGVEVLALDRGQGMGDIARCFQDGYSTAGSPGTGLGAVARLSTFHDIYTAPGKGVALFAQICRKPPRPAPASLLEIGGVSVPMRGETECGDDFAVCGSNILVVDGLGHGPIAAECARAAVLAFEESDAASPADLMRIVHGALRSTRGAAVSIAQVDITRGELRYAGIGNIAGSVWNEGGPRHLLSHPGIVGHDMRNVRELTYRLSDNVLVLLYSDGIATHWSLDAYEGLPSRHPSLIAGVIYRDHSRRRDDATVIVVRERAVA
jgi:anti-sigma regulatory factor (Ser/Thr protein kinase)